MLEYELASSLVDETDVISLIVDVVSSLDSSLVVSLIEVLDVKDSGNESPDDKDKSHDATVNKTTRGTIFLKMFFKYVTPF